MGAPKHYHSWLYALLLLQCKLMMPCPYNASSRIRPPVLQSHPHCSLYSHRTRCPCYSRQQVCRNQYRKVAWVTGSIPTPSRHFLLLLQREGTKVPWKQILSKRPVWALILSHFCHNWGTFILLTWMPTYYNQVLGLDLMKSGFYSVLPWITMALAANVGGWVADSMVARGVSVTRVRKIMQSVRIQAQATV